MKNQKQDHTDREYLTKQELRKDKSFDFSDDLWNEVLEYREKYRFEIPLMINSKKKAFITQTPWILQKEIKVLSGFSKIQQEMLKSVSSRYSSGTLLDDIFNKSAIADIHWILNYGSKRNVVSRIVIDNIVLNNDEAKTAEEKKILSIFDNIKLICNEKVRSPRSIAKKFFNLDIEKKYENIHHSLIDTIMTDKIYSLITKASSIAYSLLTNDMFGEQTYEVMVLSLMSLFRNSYMSSILNGISFFKTFEFFRFEISKTADKARKNNGDITYLTQLFNTILMYFAKLSTEQIENYIKNEVRYNSLSTRDKNRNAKVIMEQNPEISSKQALFFIEHSDPRAAYTISDFQKDVGSSYETSRYSLDNLVEHGFYKKEKVGKKYVYKAVRQYT